MRNSSSLDWLRFMHTPNDYRVSPILYPGSILEKKHVVGYFFIELIYKTNMFH